MNVRVSIHWSLCYYTTSSFIFLHTHWHACYALEGSGLETCHGLKIVGIFALGTNRAIPIYPLDTSTD